MATKAPPVHTQKKSHPSIKKAGPKPPVATTAPPHTPTAPRRVRQRARKAASNPQVAVPAGGSSVAAPTAAAPAVTPLVLAPAAVLALPAVYAGLVAQPPQYDPTAGAAAFTTFAPNRAAIPADQVHIARVDIQAAALVALGAYGFIAQVPTLRAQLQAMSNVGLFLMSTLEDLETAAFAALYAFNRAEAAGAFTTSSLVPSTLIAQASLVEKRMQRRCEYVFANDPAVAPLLDLLRPGSGHNDLANDLLGYASIYASHPTEVAATNDPNYVATDLTDATSLAGQILAYLTASMGPAVQSTYDDLQRSWTLLLAIYGEVRAVASTLLRFDPKAHARFPSLTGAARAARAKPAKAAASAVSATPAAQAPSATTSAALKPAGG